MPKHPHAESMRLYAEDAAETDKPWERWECRLVDRSVLGACADWFQWHPATDGSGHPSWEPRWEFRRKPKPLECWVALYQSGAQQVHWVEPPCITESPDNRLVRVVHMREVTE